MRFHFAPLLILFLSSLLIAGESGVGSISGRVLEKATQQPLAGVNVLLEKTALGAATDLNGYYKIERIPVGSYTILFEYIGYENVARTDIMVRPDRNTSVSAEMHTVSLQSEAIVVTAFFENDKDEPVSAISFNSEEIRRSPGSAGDVSRILMALPSTAQVADNANDLMVRGGSPAENAFFIDNIQIPNINHFPVLGASGGPIGMLNVDFVDDIHFYTGGFSSVYGDRLSSVIDINFREGNRERTETQLDFSMGGIGGSVEGPVRNGQGSWLVSARRSYLDLLVKAIGTGAAPRYGDIHSKMTYDLDKYNKIEFLNIFGTSRINFGQKEAEDSGNPVVGQVKYYQNTSGLNWFHLWQGKGFSNTSLSYAVLSSQSNFDDVADGDLVQKSNYTEGDLRLRNQNQWQMNKNNLIQFGLEAGYALDDYKFTLGSYTNRVGDVVPATELNRDLRSLKLGFSLNHNWKVLPKLTMNNGLRADYFDLTGRWHVSPRLSATYDWTRRLSTHIAYGIYYQSLPMFLLSQAESNKKLKDLQANHYIAGLNYLLTADTKLTLEVYQKDYFNAPLDPADPALFVLDDGRMNSFFRNYGEMADHGRAMTRGLEITIQKKLARDFYGLISGAWFRSRYRDFDKEWHDRIYDNKFLFSMIGGYKPNERWEFSLRWTYAGGVPYTPFDAQLSEAAGTGIIDQTRINTERFPDYHSLNLRFDRRFFFRHSNLVSYMSIWNAYNQENIAGYYWDEVNNKQSSYKQWSILPVGGFELEF